MIDEQDLRASERVAVCGLTCSALVLAAGLIAKTSVSGVAIASVLLTVAAAVACAGAAAFRGHAWDLGVWALLAAALPLFAVFYGVGLTVLRSLGLAMAGDLLIAIAAILPVVTIFTAAHGHGHATPRMLRASRIRAQPRWRL
jgi:hypothetical protein